MASFIKVGGKLVNASHRKQILKSEGPPGERSSTHIMRICRFLASRNEGCLCVRMLEGCSPTWRSIDARIDPRDFGGYKFVPGKIYQCAVTFESGWLTIAGVDWCNWRNTYTVKDYPAQGEILKAHTRRQPSDHHLIDPLITTFLIGVKGHEHGYTVHHHGQKSMGFALDGLEGRTVSVCQNEEEGGILGFSV